MAIVEVLGQTLPPAILSPLRAPDLSTVDASVIDISDLTPQMPLDGAGTAWIEVPIVGADGRITGVLCNYAFLAGIPEGLPAGAGEDATSNYVHDIANLLAVIEGGLHLLDVKTGDERAMIVKRLHRAIRQGTTISRRLLDAARPERTARPPACHCGVVLDLSDLLDRTLRADVVVAADIDPGLRRFSVDPEELHLALLNLCKNSSDAMPLGGTISISARNICATPDRKWVEIAVSDEGTGMPPEVAKRMFEPYFTTKEPGLGTGLGLDQVRRFVESSRGAISVESAENEGTTVRMRFPSA